RSRRQEKYTRSASLALLAPPQGRLGDAQLLGRRADGVEEAGRVARVACRRLEPRHPFLPEAVELEHQEPAQVLAGHRSEGDAEVASVGPGLERQPHLAAQAEYAVAAAGHLFLPGDHHAARQGVLNQGGVGVTSAVLVDEEGEGLIAREQAELS